MTPVKTPEDTSRLERFRATVNLADAFMRVTVGDHVYADPTIPYIAERVEARWLVADPEPDARGD